MLPFKTLIKIDRHHTLPIFVQISNGLTHLIKSGMAPQKMKLPGTRAMSSLLGVHRMTVVAAYDELLSQGWIESIPSKGTFVSGKLPLVSPQIIDATSQTKPDNKANAGFHWYQRTLLSRPDTIQDEILTIDDGTPDVRIAPTDDIARLYKNIISRDYNLKYLNYGSVYGNYELRKLLVKHLNETRGLSIGIDNILITRGSQMGIYLAANLTLKPGDSVIVGESNYISANLTLKDTGAKLLSVSVDSDGIDTRQVEKLCKQKSVKALYVTPHHHHPTTVTLSAERRLHLLELANQYGFAILEDDYDYDFHYQSAPLLPLASADKGAMVVYIGALSKIVAPSYRIGYMIAASDLITGAASLRRIIDRQGDQILEKVMVEMFNQGYIQRHTKKALKLYKARRDYFAHQLKDKLHQYLSFEIPEGGMAFWVKLRNEISWEALSETALRHGLKLPLWTNYDQRLEKHNHIRVGFASLNNKEIDRAIEILLISCLELLPQSLRRNK